MRPVESLRTRRAPADRREVEGCLARWDLLHRPRPLGEPPSREGEPFGCRLRGALAELGPVFSAFGLYLASRIDLLAAADCLELSALPDSVPPMASSIVRERIAGELGQPAEAVVATLELEPCESRLLVQAHHARLADGQPVVLRLVRPEAVEAAERDFEKLPLLAGAFALRGWSERLLGEAIADFQRSLREAADLKSTADALGLLALDAESFGLLVPPVVRRDLTTSRLLTVENPGGIDFAAAATEAGASADGGRRRRELARLLCVAWLRQALEGRVFPLRLPEAGVRVFAGGRLAFLASACARPPLADRANLRGFLVAIASREPDDACSYLLREMTREGPEAAEEQLRLHMRQVVPFRDGAWSASGESLAEHVFVCARQARACGFRPRLHLVAFYRGLASVSLAARQLAPEDDVLLDALKEVRVLTSFSQMREAMSPGLSEWGRYAVLMSELPRKMDELLTLAATGGREREAASEALRRQRRGESSHLVLAASLMVLAALALVLHHFVQAGVLAGWGEPIAAALFLAVGGVLLWALVRTS
jgi:ubiquinone biosynthesis protein